MSNIATATEHRRMPLTPERRQTFLEVYAKTGSWAAAARAASPHASTRWGASRSFRDLAKREPEFAAACEEAREHAVGLAELEAHRRGVEGIEEPVWQGGKCVGTRRVFSVRSSSWSRRLEC